MRAKCKDCGRHHDLGEQVFGKLGGLAAGAALGGTTKHPLGVLAGGILGGLLGHWADENVLPSCPQCRGVLQLVDRLV